MAARREDILMPALTPWQMRGAVEEAARLAKWRGMVLERVDAIEAGEVLCEPGACVCFVGKGARRGTTDCHRVGWRRADHDDQEVRAFTEPCSPDDDSNEGDPTMTTKTKLDATSVLESLARLMHLRGDLLSEADLVEWDELLRAAPDYAAGRARTTAREIVQSGEADDEDIERTRALVEAARMRLASVRAERTDAKDGTLSIERARALHAQATHAIGRQVHEVDPQCVAAAARVREVFGSPPPPAARVDAEPALDPEQAHARMLERQARAAR